ncbi:Ribosome biogenesis protein erb1 [Aspergillus fumigatus]|uniref:Ribosome biogenesis protein erb1 n=1 Tax=Aspergillus fumigatus (strain ATCC MYA-4609 / CBS 101355 / FGSC A1100 / Af293) TaxID=330879 RepID=ERB1_ASPFU|nr:ribosome biogenesis protein Erb1, putative [Aspergillus fumigatus Af293]Q4WTI3.1 RecName: Full=Ribosome biogenesis protein erb1; AltName: Full=Eukaryotic ribosome biogenesis protein 1 [Aspergillus fumigatus Af293]KAH1451837.1 Ribosome biogenesis protein erb1 [Aspergillus fumigatus]EAL90249.1 ribosome biogenesis protein Erb1, putative [Aspergillus fumigatus Af293]KAH1658791.1 Ribosome biogenesis protein erb1 [Aspergillus fumigatus]KAH1732856.1 Ribosome biogenesis protein erb1 [Aspergillus fu
MNTSKASKKRKAVTRDVEEEAGVFSGDELNTGNLDGALSDNAHDLSSDEDESDSEVELIDDFSDEEDEEEEDVLDSDEIPSDGEDSAKKKSNAAPGELGAVIDDDDDDDDESPSEEEQLNYRIEKDANGNDRFVYDEINPDDNSDYSDVDENANTIGNIPLSFYDQYPHIGYDINGKKIMRPAKGEALDALLDSIEIPKGWTGLTDPSTGKPLELSQEELELLRKVQMNEIPEDGYNPYEPIVEWFTSQQEIMPLSAAPEPKRRFVPSKHEAKRVMKIVKAIREGRILPFKPPTEEDEEDDTIVKYDLWADEAERKDHPMHIPAPKLPPPGYEESYHPPPEYLPSRKERKTWEEADPEDRDREFLPNDFGSLRRVPGYENFVKEKFERCLDLYLAPRVRRSKLNIDPESLLPKLPSPEELKPFPTACATVFRGHKGRVRTLAVDPSGLWLASGGDDGTVRVWELLTGRQLWSVKLSEEDPVNVVRWRPGKDALILAAAAGDDIFLAVPPIVDPAMEKASLDILDAGWGYAASVPPPTPAEANKKNNPPKWMRPSSSLADSGVCAVIPLRYVAKSLSWHRRGDYFVTVCPGSSTPASVAIAIHTLSKHLTQYPFRRRIKGGGPPQAAHFHPSKPILFVANQRSIRAYDLSRQLLVKILQPGARWISSFDIHPTSSTASGGDNLIVGSYDRRLLWHDLELSQRPYKTLRYHRKAIRAVKFHPGGRYPLFADASDDGSLQIFHGSVTGDMLSNATIVPLKVLKGHKITGELGVLDVDWHPREPWCVSAGADGTCRLWM